jgi:hypothetical protein
LTRDEVIRRQAFWLDELFALTSGEDAARRQFEDLAIATHDHFTVIGKPGYTAPYRPSWFKDDESLALLSPSLTKRWKEWHAGYPSLLARNPLLELHDMMREISETWMFASWPAGSEGMIQDWIDRGIIDPVPFCDHREIVTDAFYQRLRELRQMCDGWLYWDQETGGIMFVPELEWQRMRLAQRQARSKINVRGG